MYQCSQKKETQIGRTVGRAQWAPWQPFLMGLLTRVAPGWRSAVLLV
jgi:hypothetical protein